MIDLPQDYELHTIRSIRNNQDTPVNECGRHVLNLCTEAKLRILNDRSQGDIQRNMIYVDFHGCNSVDLLSASEVSLKKSTLV